VIISVHYVFNRADYYRVLLLISLTKDSECDKSNISSTYT